MSQVPARVPESGDFKRQSVRGGAAAIAGQVVGTVLQVGTTFVLARLLSPSDYGLQSMVITLTAFFALFKDAGLSVASVQKEHLSEDQISTLFWINVVLGFALMVVVAAMAPLLVEFYQEPRLLWLTVASASIFFLNSLTVQHRALLDRSMRFTVSAKIDILCSVASTVVAITMAAMGFGYWALICQSISLPVVATIAVWIAMPWMPGRPRWSPELRSMVRFGSTVTFNTVVIYVAYNTEKILLGRYWGAAPLGIYGRAYQLATLPVQQLMSTIHSVAFSVLSRMQSDVRRLHRAYLKSLASVVSLIIPAVVGSALFADEIVQVVLGPRWSGSAPVLRLLAPTALVLTLLNPFSWFLRATGQVKRSLQTAFVICPAVILGILAGLRNGPSGVAMGYSVAMLIVFLPILFWSTYGTGITLHDYWEAVKRPLVAGLWSGAAGWLVQLAFQSTLAPVELLTAELAALLVVYALILLFVLGQKDFYFDLARQILKRREQLPAEG